MAKVSPIPNLSPQASVAKNARIIARAKFDEFEPWNNIVDTSYNVRGLHHLRIAAKRLRYTLELFLDTFPSSCATVLQELEQLQAELGTLHDTDVMIAVLRLCLGGLDSGTGYEQALVRAYTKRNTGTFIIPPLLIASLLNPTTSPTAEERYGLEYLLLCLQQEREKLYTDFNQHWHMLQARDFRREILSILDA